MKIVSPHYYLLKSHLINMRKNTISQISKLQACLIDDPLSDAVAHFCPLLIFGPTVPPPMPKGVYTAE